VRPDREAHYTPAVRLLLALALAGLAGCSVGTGEGDITGTVTANGCFDVDPDFDLEPTFFGATPTVDGLELRVQAGSTPEDFADGLHIFVSDPDEVALSRLGWPLEVSEAPDAEVQMVLNLMGRCDAGFPTDFFTRPWSYPGVGGTIVFDAIYAPEVDPDATLIDATLDVRFEDPADPENRNGRLQGGFRFFFQRGGPAQPFP
jgi:hypothetical protein